MSLPLCLPLADADTESATGQIWFWSIALILLVVVCFVAIAFFRRKLSPDEDFHGVGFTLGDFRRMVKDGKMTPEEFEKAKAALLSGMQPIPPPDDLPGNRTMRSEK
jgi:hypothetical protein